MTGLTSSGKMSKVVSLIFVLAGSVVERSDGVSCYNCEYYSYNPERSTCIEPRSADGTSTCNGSACVFVQLNFTRGGREENQPYYTVTRNCTNSSKYLLEFCLAYQLENSVFFVSGNSCCYRTQKGGVEFIHCYCHQNNCNGDLPHEAPATSDQPSDTTRKTSNAGDQPSDTTRKTSNAGDQPSDTTRKTSNAGDQPSDTTRKTSNAGDQPSDTTRKALNSGSAVKPFNDLSNAAVAIITVLSTSLLSNFYI